MRYEIENRKYNYIKLCESCNIYNKFNYLCNRIKISERKL